MNAYVLAARCPSCILSANDCLDSEVDCRKHYVTTDTEDEGRRDLKSDLCFVIEKNEHRHINSRKDPAR